MSHPLLDCPAIEQPPAEYLRSVGAVFAEFGAGTQDSGNVSYGVRVGADRFFVKTAGRPDDPRPYLDHAGRVALLRNAVRLHASVQHPLAPGPMRVIESPAGPMLVYHWLDGELLGVPRARRDDAASPFARFRGLPADTIRACLDDVFDLHAAQARAGWVASDFYDGCLLYDFAAARLWVMDLDTYRLGPFRNDMGRMFGSDRFMAPEEHELGALIDERTTVFTLGRAALVFLSDGTLNAEAFRGPRALLHVATRACAPDPADRFQTVAALLAAWRGV
jgi:serine/threonine-protein kinase